MNLSTHLIFSILLAAILAPFIGYQALWIIFGGFFIDVDHYFYYAFRHKTLSIPRAYHYHKRERGAKYEPDILHIFHTVEFLLLVVLFIIITYSLKWHFFFSFFTFTFIGMLFHLILDLLHMAHADCFDARAVSLLGWLKRKGYF